MMSQQNNYDFISEVARAAVGQWASTFNHLGIEVPASRMKHSPCPNCGGKDRFRCDDKEGRGTYICNQCGAGDGLDLVAKANGCSPLDAARMVASLVGISEGEPQTEAQKQRIRAKVKQQKEERQRKEKAEIQRKIKKARMIWESGQQVSPTNEYLASSPTANPRVA